MTEILKTLVSSRGVQLIARYAGIGLVWLAAKAQATVEQTQIDATATVVGTLAAGGVCLLIDFISHKFQKDAPK